MTLLLVMFGLLAIGMVLVIYGTIVKNKWGINLDAVSCPRCATPLPQVRRPQNLRQALWGGGTCPNCGIEVDKWGREVRSYSRQYPAWAVEFEGHVRKGLKRRPILITALGYFCLTLLFQNWRMSPSKGGLPSTLFEWVIVLALDAAESVTFAAFFYFVLTLVGRLLVKKSGNDSRGGHRA